MRRYDALGLALVKSKDIRTFREMEDDFVAVMSAFDQRVAAGEFTSGQNQNKGFFFGSPRGFVRGG